VHSSSQALVLIMSLFFTDLMGKSYIVFFIMCWLILCCHVIYWHLRGFFSPISVSSLCTECVNPSIIMYSVKYYSQFDFYLHLGVALLLILGSLTFGIVKALLVSSVVSTHFPGDHSPSSLAQQSRS